VNKGGRGVRQSNIEKKKVQLKGELNGNNREWGWVVVWAMVHVLDQKRRYEKNIRSTIDSKETREMTKSLMPLEDQTR